MNDCSWSYRRLESRPPVNWWIRVNLLSGIGTGTISVQSPWSLTFRASLSKCVIGRRFAIYRKTPLCRGSFESWAATSRDRLGGVRCDFDWLQDWGVIVLRLFDPRRYRPISARSHQLGGNRSHQIARIRLFAKPAGAGARGSGPVRLKGRVRLVDGRTRRCVMRPAGSFDLWRTQNVPIRIASAEHVISCLVHRHCIDWWRAKCEPSPFRLISVDDCPDGNGR